MAIHATATRGVLRNQLRIPTREEQRVTILERNNDGPFPSVKIAYTDVPHAESHWVAEDSLTTIGNKPALIQALTIARDLNEPGEHNKEYVRGQMNLIADIYGLSLANDTIYELLTSAIIHSISAAGAVEAIDALLYSYER